MNLINKKVTHKSFGVGSIVTHNDTVIEIHFAAENKKFIFPDVFEKHLQLHDKNDALSLEKIIQKKEVDRIAEKSKLEEEEKLQRDDRDRRFTHNKLLKNHKLHAESQLAYWCDEEEQKQVFTDWRVFSGITKSGSKKGEPTKPIRLYPNSAVLLTAVDAGAKEKDRRIIGVYMVKEDYVGKVCEDGFIPAHSKYKLELTEEESAKMLFWTFYLNEKSPLKTTWHSGKHRYFSNMWMAQILKEIVALRTEPTEREFAQQFFEYFCKKNDLAIDELAKPNGALLRSEA